MSQPLNRLEPYRFIFPVGTSVEEATATALYLEIGLVDAEQYGAQHVRLLCNGLVLTTCN